MKWYRDVYTELPRRLNGYILHDDIGEVFSFPRYSVPGVKGGYKVSGMAGEREESSGATRVFLWIVHDLASYQLVFPLIGLKTEENLPQKGLYRSISGRVFVFGPRDSHGNWTWKPAWAAEVRWMLSPSSKVNTGRGEGMVDRKEL
jgi:hypothetical protein